MKVEVGAKVSSALSCGGDGESVWCVVCVCGTATSTNTGSVEGLLTFLALLRALRGRRVALARRRVRHHNRLPINHAPTRAHNLAPTIGH